MDKSSNHSTENPIRIEYSDFEALNKEIYSFINLCMDTPNAISLLPSLNDISQEETTSTKNADGVTSTEIDILGPPPGLENVDENMQFLRAAFLGNCFALRRFIGKGINIHHCDKVGRNALHYAVAGGRESAVKMLIVAGIKIDIADCKNWTPLLIAVNKNFKQEVKILLDYDADISAELKHNLFPCRSIAAKSQAIHFAAIQKNIDITKMLLMKGANINALDSTKRTPLHYAACRDNTDYLKWLLEKGASINSLDVHNRSPLHASCMSGNWNNSLVLLENGCPHDIIDIWDFTPIDLAMIRGFKYLESQFKSYLGRNSIEYKPSRICLGELEETVFLILSSGLKEKKVNQIKRAVHRLGSLTCLELYQKTLTIEEKGGKMTNDGSRRKTSGGIFFSLIKERVRSSLIPKSDWEYIWQEEKELLLKYKSNKTKSRSLSIAKNYKEKSVNTQQHSTTVLVPIVDRVTSHPINPQPTIFNQPFALAYPPSTPTLIPLAAIPISSRNIIIPPPPPPPKTHGKKKKKY